MQCVSPTRASPRTEDKTPPCSHLHHIVGSNGLSPEEAAVELLSVEEAELPNPQQPGLAEWQVWPRL
jgi:hypothetical protein